MQKTMKEWSMGQLHSGSKRGPIVTSQKQAVAIGLDEARTAGLKTPPAPKAPKLRKPRKDKGMAKVMHPGDADALPIMHSSRHH